MVPMHDRGGFRGRTGPSPWGRFLACSLIGLGTVTADGAQTNGPNWIWWEAEDAVQHTFPAGGYFAPANPAEREKLSGGD